MPDFFSSKPLPELLRTASQKRAELFQDPDTNAFRLFNGFYEGCHDLCIDRYANTAVIQWMAKAKLSFAAFSHLHDTCLEVFPEIDTVILKDRRFGDPADQPQNRYPEKGLPSSVLEWGVSYPIDLQINKDCGFYLDTALLRKWLLENASGKRVLNTFAYTGSLGDAAAAGGALSVTQTDINHNYLSARHSNQEYILGDFFHVSAALRRSGRLFDLIILDPPFYANAGRSAKVDQVRNAAALINKIRPLAAHHGKIIAINNALFLSGKDYLAQVETLCGPCLSISEMIPVPESFFGYTPVDGKMLPADPAPFNHPTKIIVLDVLRKDERA